MTALYALTASAALSWLVIAFAGMSVVAWLARLAARRWPFQRSPAVVVSPPCAACAKRVEVGIEALVNEVKEAKRKVVDLEDERDIARGVLAPYGIRPSVIDEELQADEHGYDAGILDGQREGALDTLSLLEGVVPLLEEGAAGALQSWIAGQRKRFVQPLVLCLALALSALVPGCALGDSVWKCAYTYDRVVGCGAHGMPITTVGTDTEVVQAPDAVSACLAVSEYVTLVGHPDRIHLICHPTTCENLGPVPAPTKPGSTPQGVPGDAGADPPAIVCDGGAPSGSGCGQYVPDPSALLQVGSCATCFADGPNGTGQCCFDYQAALAQSAASADVQAYAACWLDSTGQSACPTSPAPAAAAFNACMLESCSGACGSHP